MYSSKVLRSSLPVAISVVALLPAGCDDRSVVLDSGSDMQGTADAGVILDGVRPDYGSSMNCKLFCEQDSDCPPNTRCQSCPGVGGPGCHMNCKGKQLYKKCVPARSCSQHNQCGPAGFCRRQQGCLGPGKTGTCTPRPDLCPGLLKHVCGCDGTTYYSDTCDANRGGTNVAYPGKCKK